MAIRLEKGQRINLEKETGAKLTNFCVGCNSQKDFLWTQQFGS